MVIHTIGASVQDMVISSSVRDGLSMRCGKCRKGCVVGVGRGRSTRQDDLQGVTMFCPYCGAEGELMLSNEWGGRIIDTRPTGED